MATTVSPLSTLHRFSRFSTENADITTRYLQQIEVAEFGASLGVLIRLRRALDCRWNSLSEGIG